MLYVVLVATRNPLNIGAAARAMSNFGFLHLRVVNPYDIAWREARSAVGAAQLLAHAEQFDSVAKAVADCSLVIGTTAATNRDPQQPLHSLPSAAAEILHRSSSENVAVLFGSEKRGLSNHDLAHCHQLLRIPTRSEHSSMNLGQSVAVTLYALAQIAPSESLKLTQDEVPGSSDKPPVSPPSTEPVVPATSANLERLITLLLEMLHATGYTKPRTAGVTEEKLRRMVRRLNPNAEDATTLLGMFRKIAHVIFQKTK